MLSGLFIDVLIAYVIKLIIRLRRLRGSRNWRPVTAKIVASRFEDNWVWNCPTVHIVYTYQIDGQPYSGMDSKPFFFSSSHRESRSARAGKISAEAR